MDISIGKNGLELLADGKAIKTFEWPLERAVETAFGILVLIDRKSRPQGHSGVMLLDFKGQIKWVAEGPPHDEPYIGAGIYKGELLVGTWSGWQYTLDPETGKRIASEWQK